MSKILSSYYKIKGKLRVKAAKKIGHEKFARSFSHYAGKKMRSCQELNDIIYNGLMSEKPFMACRFGSAELQATGTFDFERKKDYPEMMSKLTFNAGFFPNDNEHGKRFAQTMINACREVNVLGVWFYPYEDYYVKSALPGDAEIGYLMYLEPWKCDRPWTRALTGKKVLVIHPFEDSIIKQYSVNRKKIFNNQDVLPEFELKTLKAVQTAAGEIDDRFNTWFDALNYMYEEAMKIDFDIAILGCGAYGMPLAAMLKKAGKKAIHLGGVTQILFGVKGKRWEEEKSYQYIKDMMNDYWTYPLDSERPSQASKVENSCYWGK